MTPGLFLPVCLLDAVIAISNRKDTGVFSTVCPSCIAQSDGLVNRASLQHVRLEDSGREALQMLQASMAPKRSAPKRSAPKQSTTKKTVKKAKRRHDDYEALAPELRAVLPIAPVAMPLTGGTTFMRTVMSIPGVCSGVTCPGLMRNDMGNLGIEEWPGFAKGKGHFMTMMRSPAQRVISAYRDMEYAYSHLNVTAFLDKTTTWGGWMKHELPSLRQYAFRSAGCITRMLTRDDFPCGWRGGRTEQETVVEAKKRLRTGFAFVGISDQWALSMCLFSTMFKVPCQARMFKEPLAHPRVVDPLLFGTGVLDSVADPYDDAVFAEAMDIFKANLDRYNVSEASCKTCYLQAGLEQKHEETQPVPGVPAERPTSSAATLFSQSRPEAVPSVEGSLTDTYFHFH